MNITFKNGEKILSITMDDTSLSMFITDILNILGNRTFTKGYRDKQKEIRQAETITSAKETKEDKEPGKADVLHDIFGDILKKQMSRCGYNYPDGLSKAQTADLTAMSLDSAALKHIGRKMVKCGKEIQSYSLYEIKFLKSMQEAGMPTEVIYDEYIKNPYCKERSMAAVRTRLSILKHS